ncbi:MAG: PriCT-2 domain-containing protein, partial [Gammaproteobacteria bacterium]|nr:PriCT-2 domain-containing protein [Gammaproteobacteria bacterium]
MNEPIPRRLEVENLTWTELPNKTGKTMNKHSGSWLEFIERLKTVGTFPAKKQCPWLKLATFGDKRSEKGSLRHNANVVTVTGLEADYDGEVMSMATAKEQLERHGIRAALYPSPSSTPEKPRWRAVCPLSRPHAPEQRQRFMGWLNGALGGVLAGESFTLSQGYFFGATPTNHYHVLVTFDDPDDGTCIDQLDNLDEIAISKSHGGSSGKDGRALSPPSAVGAPVTDQTVEDLRSALQSMSADDRSLWVRMGMALKPLGDVGRDLWLEWSTKSSKFDSEKDPSTWESFRPTITGYQAVFAEAQRSGWINPARNPRGAHIADVGDFECLDEGLSPSDPADPARVDADSLATLDAAYPLPFRGIMTDVVRSALAVSNKPQPYLCTLSALIGMAASCSGIYSLPSGMRLNLYGCGVAGTGEGKDQPRSIATTICKASGGSLIGKSASGPGLEDCLVSHTGTLIALDEIAHFFAAINSGKAPPHLIELAGTLLQLFSASRNNYHTRIRAATKGAIPSRVIRNPVVSLLGFATPEKLGEAVGISNIEDGLLGRFVFAFGQPGVTPRRV